MKIKIEETGQIKELSIIDVKSGIDYIQDFIGNYGAFSDGQFEYDKDNDLYICDQDTFDWWSKVTTDNEALQQRLTDFMNDYDLDQEELHAIIMYAENADLEDYANYMNQVLDEYEKKHRK